MPSALSLEDIYGRMRRSDGYVLMDKGCYIGDIDSNQCKPDAPLQVLSLGNSFNYIGYNMFVVSYGNRDDVNVVGFGPINDCDFQIQNSTITALGVGIGKADCLKRTETLNSAFANSVDVLVISSAGLFSRTEELSIIDFLRSRNKDLKIVVIGDYIHLDPAYTCMDIIQRFGDDVFCKDRKFVVLFGDNPQSKPYYTKYMEYNPVYIDVVGMLCPERKIENCPTEAGGAPMFYDHGHLSLEFTMRMGRRMLEEYSGELTKIGFPPVEK